jgi:hypothetical protein
MSETAVSAAATPSAPERPATLVLRRPSARARYLRAAVVYFFTGIWPEERRRKLRWVAQPAGKLSGNIFNSPPINPHLHRSI